MEFEFIQRTYDITIHGSINSFYLQDCIQSKQGINYVIQSIMEDGYLCGEHDNMDNKSNKMNNINKDKRLKKEEKDLMQVSLFLVDSSFAGDAAPNSLSIQLNNLYLYLNEEGILNILKLSTPIVRAIR